ncbi:hypothetical protein TESG_06684 [Trichophyton tonsurans CBS 112818]|uniref:Uncharacterized protein n=1 Tax=Trichophyton tonsurans (strain CBS 112818) TaxID=647933 RepID=F2S6Y0_TRIT1|nr:hypothetical protein TESG_06684 [Trichophyton tonsurans CBS 112818]
MTKLHPDSYLPSCHRVRLDPILPTASASTCGTCTPISFIKISPNAPRCHGFCNDRLTCKLLIIYRRNSATSMTKRTPKNGRCFKNGRLLLDILSFVLISPLSPTIVGSSLPSMLEIYQSPDLQSNYAFGPLIASPLSEIYGRVPVIQSWNLRYLVFNTICGGARSKSAGYIWL